MTRPKGRLGLWGCCSQGGDDNQTGTSGGADLRLEAFGGWVHRALQWSILKSKRHSLERYRAEEGTLHGVHGSLGVGKHLDTEGTRLGCAELGLEVLVREERLTRPICQDIQCSLLQGWRQCACLCLHTPNIWQLNVVSHSNEQKFKHSLRCMESLMTPYITSHILQSQSSENRLILIERSNFR